MNPETDLQHPLFTRFFVPICRVFSQLFFLVLGPLRTRGKYRVPQSGSVLILANHLSDFDPVALQIACPREVYFMAKSELFEMRILGRIIRWFRAFPVKRGEPDRDAIKKAVGLLLAGKAVCVFPEGQISEDGELQELKSGVALIARMAQCPVICCQLSNTNRVIPYGAVVPRPAFCFVRANWGEPRSFAKHVAPEEFLSWARAELTSGP